VSHPKLKILLKDKNKSLFNKIFVAAPYVSLWMFLVFFRVSLLVQGFLGLLGGVVAFTALSVALEVLRVMEVWS